MILRMYILKMVFKFSFQKKETFYFCLSEIRGMAEEECPHSAEQRKVRHFLGVDYGF